MIQKIRDLLQMQEEVRKVGDQMKSQTEAFVQMNREVQELARKFTELQKNILHEQTKSEQERKELVVEQKKLTEEFRVEINEFKTAKTQLTRQLLANATVGLEEELGKIRADVAQYNELKREMTMISSRIIQMSTEIVKLTDISSKIRAQDFELTHYAKEIFRADKEKVELLKKIDALERLVAKSRSRN